LPLKEIVGKVAKRQKEFATTAFLWGVGQLAASAELENT
jgi:hypothetical protein